MINIENKEEVIFDIENAEKRSIIDVDLWMNYLSVLYDKNEVIVYNLNTKKPVFKANYKDATDHVVRLFYLPALKEEQEEAVP